MYNGEVHASVYKKDWYLAGVQRWVLHCADGFTSPMINGEILRPSLYRRCHFADDQRQDIASFITQTVSLRRWSTSRYCVLHYTDGFTSPMTNGEILRPSLYRRCHFADDQRRDIASFFIQTVSLHRWSTARFPICIILRIFNQTDCDMKKADFVWRTPSIEKFKAHRLAKVHIFLSEVMKKSCGKFLPRFDNFVYLQPTAKYTRLWIFTWKVPKQIAWQRLSAFYLANSLIRAPRCSIEQGSEGFTNAFKIRTENVF